MTSLFISYRREDSAGYAGRIYDRLAQRFGENNVFMDVATLEVGQDFVQAIEDSVQRCRAIVVLIGPKWLNAAQPDGARRLDAENDFVRLEIQSGLRAGILVVPVLVGGAQLPAANDLPAELASLCRRNALEISDTRFDYDIERLVAALAKGTGLATLASEDATPARRNRLTMGITAMVLLVLIAIGAYIFTPPPEPTAGQNTHPTNFPTPAPIIDQTPPDDDGNATPPPAITAQPSPQPPVVEPTNPIPATDFAVSGRAEL